MSDQERIDKLEELLRCAQAARDSYRSETYQLKERLKNAEENERELSDQNADLRCSLRVAYDKLFNREGAEVAA